MAEEVIISIKLEKGENEKQVDSLTQKITDLTKANNDLKKSNNELIKSGQENSKEYIENTRQLEINKQKISEATASRKNLINTIIAEDDSIKGLRARNAELIKQRDQLSTSTLEGKQRIAEINEEIDKNNKTIKDNSSALEKQKINIGNYASALDGIAPGISGFVNGIQQMTQAAKVFIASPIGIVLAGIALALAPLISFFRDTAIGADIAARESEGFSLVIDNLKDNINEAGEAEEGFFVKLGKHIKIAVPGLGSLVDAYNGVAEAGRDYADALDTIEDEQAAFSVAAAETENEIKRLVLQSKNRTTSEEERIKLIDQALALESNLQLKRQQFADDELFAIVNRNKERLKSVGIIQQEGELNYDFAKRIVDLVRDTTLSSGDQIADQLIESLKKVNQAAGESIAIEEKLQNQRDALQDKAEEKRKKAEEQAEKDKQKAEADRQKELEEIQKQNEEISAAEEQQFKNNIEFLDRKNAEELTKIKERYLEEEITKQEFEAAITAAEIAGLEERKAFLQANGEEVAAIESQIVDRKIKAAERERDAKKKIALEQEKAEQQKIKNAQTIADTAVSIFREGTLAYQVTASAQALVDTYAAATSATKPPPVGLGPIAGIPLAILTTARGLANVARINGVQFAKGGIAAIGGILSGPSHAGGGIPFAVGGRVGFEAEGGEAIINRKSTSMFRPLLSMINEAGGGKSFGKGGVTRYQTGSIIAATQSRQAFTVAEDRMISREIAAAMMANLPPIVVTVEDINAKTQEVSDTITKATVIS